MSECGRDRTGLRRGRRWWQGSGHAHAEDASARWAAVLRARFRADGAGTARRADRPRRGGRSDPIEAIELPRATPTNVAECVRDGGGVREWRLRRVTWRATVHHEDRAQGTAGAARAQRCRAAAWRCRATAPAHPVPPARGHASGWRRCAGLPAASPEGRARGPVERSRLRQPARGVALRGRRGRARGPDRPSLTEPAPPRWLHQVDIGCERPETAQGSPSVANLLPRRAPVRSRSALSRMKPSASFWS